MKCNDCKNFKVQKETIQKNGDKNSGGTCIINNTVCNPEDDCKTGLFDKTGAI